MNETNTNITKNKLKKTVSKKLEWDFNVPDYKNDILKISDLYADGYITDYSIKDNCITAKVTVKANMLYIPDAPEEYEPKISSLESTESFVIKADIPPEFAWDTEDTDFVINSCIPTVINSRKAGIRVNSSLVTTLVKNTELSVRFPDDICIETKKKKISAVYIPVMLSEKIDFSHTFAIPNGKPDIKELLRYCTCIRNKEVKAVANKAVLKGDLVIKLIYISSQNTAECFEYTAPFTEIADARGIAENMELMFTAVPKNICVKAYSDGENCRRNVDVSGYTLFKLTAFVKNEAEIVCDAFCPEYEDECVREDLNYSDISKCLRDSYTLKETVYAEDSDFAEICDITADILTKEAVIENGNVNISSEVIFNIIYKSQAGIKCEKKTASFDFSQNVPQNENYSSADICCELADTSFVITSANSAEIRCNIIFETRLLSEESENIVTEIKVNREKRALSGAAPITAYYPSEKEELFTIAKKYHTTVNSLKEANSLTENFVSPGSFIIIS